MSFYREKSCDKAVKSTNRLNTGEFLLRFRGLQLKYRGAMARLIGLLLALAVFITAVVKLIKAVQDLA